jgi:hypothetical protein
VKIKMQTIQESQTKAKARRKVSLARTSGLILLSLGGISLVLSIVYASLISALIGLGLIFWGAILTYIQGEKYVKESVLNAVLMPYLTTLDRTLQELRYSGKGVYLPPVYLKNPEQSRVYILRLEETSLPSPDQIQKLEDESLNRSAQGLLLIPPGASLTALFEETLGTSFIRRDLPYLQQNLPKLLIEDLEIATSLRIVEGNSRLTHQINDSPGQIEARQDKIEVEIVTSTFKDVCRDARQLACLYAAVGCPLSSALACTFAKAIGKPIVIENQSTSEDGQQISISYRVLDQSIDPFGTEKSDHHIVLSATAMQAETPNAKQQQKSISHVMKHMRLSSLVTLILISSGLTIFAWVGWLVWYDMTTWSKDVITIFFGSRTGEAISLGVGMKVIYYFAAGVVLLLFGLIALLRRRRHRTNKTTTSIDRSGIAEE